MKRYTLGFIFTPFLDKVLLIHKVRPHWQKGRTNGIGGQAKVKETFVACISHKTLAETSLIINQTDWMCLGKLYSDTWQVRVYSTIYFGKLSDAKSEKKEKVEWVSIKNLPLNVIDHVRWIIPFAIDKMKNKKIDLFSVKY